MLARTLTLYSGLAVGLPLTVAGQAHDRGMLEIESEVIHVEPLSVAPAVLVDGRVERTGAWIDLATNRPPSTGLCIVFDCFGDSNSDGIPDNTSCDDLGDKDRWRFGTSYCNGLVTNDMSGVTPNDEYGRVDFAWRWTCDGGLGYEQCVIGVFTQESTPHQPDRPGCEPDSFDYEGWVIDFGTLSCGHSGYLLAQVDISDIGGWRGVTDGDGSYAIAFLTDDGESLATCAQPMLWGTGNNRGDPLGGRGMQFTEQLDDDEPLNGRHEIPTECHTYDLGVCPDPLGAMLQFWGTNCPPRCELSDCNQDRVVNSIDFICFLNLWSADDPDADCNGDGTISSADVTCFLNAWVPCRT